MQVLFQPMCPIGFCFYFSSNYTLSYLTSFSSLLIMGQQFLIYSSFHRIELCR